MTASDIHNVTENDTKPVSPAPADLPAVKSELPTAAPSAKVQNAKATAPDRAARKQADKKIRVASVPKTPPTKSPVKISTTPVPKTPAKPRAKAPAKEAAKAPQQANPVAKVSIEKVPKQKKPKLVRDSFTIPKSEYSVLDDLKQRSVKIGNPAKKSELLRAGIKALAAMTDATFKMALNAVPTIKTGRPAKD